MSYTYSMFAAIFDWSAIQTGFLFTVYGFVFGKTNGFVASIKDTTAMRRFIGTVKKAMSTGFALTFFSMGLLIYPPQPVGWGYIISVTCISLFLWAFILFCVVGHGFGILLNTKDQEHPYGAT